MNRFLRFLIASVTILVFLFASVGQVAMAQGTVPCDTSVVIGGNNDGQICSADITVNGSLGGGEAHIDEFENPAWVGGPLPPGSNALGAGVRLTYTDANGEPVYFVDPPTKICFPYAEGLIRRWLSPAELTKIYGGTFTSGQWLAYPTYLSQGMICTNSYFSGIFAPFSG